MRTSMARSNEDKTYTQQMQMLTTYMTAISINTQVQESVQLRRITCKEPNTKLRSGCAGNEPWGISEKHPARTWVQEAYYNNKTIIYNICIFRKKQNAKIKNETMPQLNSNQGCNDTDMIRVQGYNIS